MSNFKVGDKVRYTYDSWFPFSKETLEFGGIYTVKDVSEKSILLENGWYPAKYFLYVDQNQKPPGRPKYVLVDAKKDEFLQQVNELIAKGYKPQGGVAVDQAYYIQALVLEK